MDNNEKDKIEVIVKMIDEQIASGADMLLSTRYFLTMLKCVATGEEIQVSRKEKEPRVIISCDASIKVNPGGPASVGVVVEFPEYMKRPNLEFAQITMDTTNNLAEYNAIYTGLVTLFNLINNPGCIVEVRSDSQLAIKQLKEEMACKDQKLLNRRDAIKELVAALPVKIEFVWRPRCSTPELKQANYLCQDVLGVPRH